MRTLIVSDLHLGSASETDLLRRPSRRAALLERLDDIDRLVLLGDVFELRHGPARDALAAGREFFEQLGRALGDKEVVMTVGNHDHALLAPWLEQRGAGATPAPLGLDTKLQPGELTAGPAALVEWAKPASLGFTYPGLWVREDVYATHGHYLDVHLTVPSFERMGAGVMGLLARGTQREGPHSAEDYETRLAPLYAWIGAMARYGPTPWLVNGSGTVGIWRYLRGRPQHGADSARAAKPTRRRLLRQRLLPLAAARAFPLAIAGMNRAGVGPLNADLSRAEITRAALSAMREVARRLQIDAEHVIFGHTHRAGPLPDDDESAWAGLYNCGSWVYETHFMSRASAQSPYWPGRAVLVEDQGPPQLLGLLDQEAPEALAKKQPVPA